jgi:hypothetical protein
MNAYGAVEVKFPAFLSSAPDEGEWSTSRSGNFIPAEGAPGTHWIRGWVGPNFAALSVTSMPASHHCLLGVYFHSFLDSFNPLLSILSYVTSPLLIVYRLLCRNLTRTGKGDRC